MNRWLCALALLAAWPVYAADGAYSAAVGAEYSRGDFGTGSTTSFWTVPVSLGYAADAYGWKVEVPFVVVSGNGSVVYTGVGMQQVVSHGSRSNAVTQAGLGDVVAGFSLRLKAEGKVMPRTALTAKVKLPTADRSRNLGTGETDYALQLDLAKGRFDGYVGRRVLGDPPGIDFNDVNYGAVAVNFTTGPASDLALEFYAEGAALPGTEKRELTATFGLLRGSRRRHEFYLLKGFADGSPDWGVGVTTRFML